MCNLEKFYFLTFIIQLAAIAPCQRDAWYYDKWHWDADRFITKEAFQKQVHLGFILLGFFVWFDVRGCTKFSIKSTGLTYHKELFVFRTRALLLNISNTVVSQTVPSSENFIIYKTPWGVVLRFWSVSNTILYFVSVTSQKCVRSHHKNVSVTLQKCVRSLNPIWTI